MAATAILLGPAAKASGPRVTLALRNFFTKEDDPTGQQADPQHMLGHCWVHFLHEKMLPLLSPRLKLRMLLVSKPGPGIMNKGLSNDATWFAHFACLNLNCCAYHVVYFCLVEISICVWTILHFLSLRISPIANTYVAIFPIILQVKFHLLGCHTWLNYTSTHQSEKRH